MARILLSEKPDGPAWMREILETRQLIDKHRLLPRDISANYKLAGPPAHIARRVYKNLLHLKSLVPPRVCAAGLRTIWNGWCTERRFQRRWGESNVCMLGCKGGAEDSIEHYPQCPVVQQAIRSQLRVRVPNGRAMSFWMMNECPEHDYEEFLTAYALIIYATYNATNTYRHNGVSDSERALDCVKQFVIQGVRGHEKATQFLDTGYSNGHIIRVD